jgi:hypothetical protein
VPLVAGPLHRLGREKALFAWPGFFFPGSLLWLDFWRGARKGKREEVLVLYEEPLVWEFCGCRVKRVEDVDGCSRNAGLESWSGR